MTSGTTRQTQPEIVARYDVPERRDTTDLPRVAFRINDEVFVVVMPKMMIGAGMIALMEQPDAMLVADLGLELTRLLWGFVEYIEPELAEETFVPNPDYTEGGDEPEELRVRGRQRISARLNDPHDTLDLTDVQPVFLDVAAAIFKRPTKPLRASSPKRNGTGRGSGAASRAKRVKTS